MIRQLRHALIASVIVLFAASLQAQTCPTGSTPEIRFTGLHCTSEDAPMACGVASPVTLFLWDTDKNQPYQLQSCETTVDWNFTDLTPIVTGLTAQHTYAAPGSYAIQVIIHQTGSSVRVPYRYIAMENGLMTWSSIPAIVSEGDGSINVHLHTTYAPTSLTYSVTNDDNAAGRFTPLSGTVSFAAGETDKTITVPLIDDTVPQGIGRIHLTLTAPTNGVAWNMGTFINMGAQDFYIYIADNDTGGPPPTLNWSAPTYGFSENAGAALLTVNRTGDTSKTVTADYSVGPPTPPAIVSGTVTFNANETSKTISVPVPNDNVWMPDRTWIAILLNPSAGTVLGSTLNGTNPIDATVTITDDDPSAFLSIDDAPIKEGNAGRTMALLTVSLSAPMASPFSATLTYEGTATAGIDYEQPRASISFGAGETSKTVAISIIGDTQIEPNETVRATLSHVTGSGALPGISKATGTLTILNDDYSMTWLKLAAGTSGPMTIYLGNPTPAQDVVTLTSSKPDVVRVPDSFVAESGRSVLGFEAEALSPGESMITAKFPASLGGLTLTANVEVHSDQAPATVVVTHVGPPTGPATGGTLATVAGLNFTPSCIVSFGDTPARTVSFVSTSELNVTTPAHATGATDVTVMCDAEEFTLTSGFTFFTPPTRSRGVRH